MDSSNLSGALSGGGGGGGVEWGGRGEGAMGEAVGNIMATSDVTAGWLDVVAAALQDTNYQHLLSLHSMQLDDAVLPP